jgi:hypothetical protein
VASQVILICGDYCSHPTTSFSKAALESRAGNGFARQSELEVGQEETPGSWTSYNLQDI